MQPTKAFAAQSPTSQLEPFSIQRRKVGDRDLLIEIDYCGVCHSDLHQVRNEWGTSTYPMVPGHEIVGHVARVGKDVKKFKVGDLAGVGCMVDSCRTCPSCKQGFEQYCEKQTAWTYNSTELDGKTPTYGGYSSQIVVDKKFALKISPALNLAEVAPLLCAGITTYSPLRHWNTKKGDRVGVLGLGGLGHMAVKLAAAMGAEVTMLSSSSAKEADARHLGAHAFALTSEETTFKKLAGHFDLIIDTVSAPHDLNKYLGLLRIEGAMVLLGVPPKPAEVGAFGLIMGRKSLSGSLIGGIAETQEMLDFCAEKGITSDIELIPIQQINEAYERMLRGDVRYRFVIDMKTV
jgi:alcohol dehydrogenase (NADP+)